MPHRMGCVPDLEVEDVTCLALGLLLHRIGPAGAQGVGDGPGLSLCLSAVLVGASQPPLKFWLPLKAEFLCPPLRG